MRHTFSEGVAPGGLWSQNDIRILICYLLCKVNGSLSEKDITDIIQETAIANYFETQEAISALLQLGNLLRDSEGRLSLTPEGETIAGQLETILPLSVRDRARTAALRLMARAKNQRENRVEIEALENGYCVRCHISGGALDLMSISLYVPDKGQAKLVREKFYQNPAAVYEQLLSALTSQS